MTAGRIDHSADGEGCIVMGKNLEVNQ